MSHTISIDIKNNRESFGTKQHVTVIIEGDGSLDHMIDAFKSALVAAGFSLDTAKKLDELDV